MQIGRRIYFEKATGNVILDTGEREGDVILTSSTQDFAMYVPLQNYAQEAVGSIKIPYGQDRDNFGVYHYHIDPATLQIVWDLTPIQQEEQTRQLSQQEQIDNLRRSDDLISSDLTSLTEILAEKGLV